jgi:hypothetical protein
MGNKRLLDAIERGFDIGRRFVAFAFPIPDRSRMTSSSPGEIRLREPSQHAARPNLPSRNNVTHDPNLYIDSAHATISSPAHWEKGQALRS